MDLLCGCRRANSFCTKFLLLTLLLSVPLVSSLPAVWYGKRVRLPRRAIDDPYYVQTATVAIFHYSTQVWRHQHLLATATGMQYQPCPNIPQFRALVLSLKSTPQAVQSLSHCYAGPEIARDSARAVSVASLLSGASVSTRAWHQLLRGARRSGSRPLGTADLNRWERYCGRSTAMPTSPGRRDLFTPCCQPSKIHTSTCLA